MIAYDWYYLSVRLCTSHFIMVIIYVVCCFKF
nr:MAG TPA: hypothetical protein [Caudoviricetes sp.]